MMALSESPFCSSETAAKNRAMSLKSLSAKLVTRLSAALILSSGSFAPNRACRASSSPLDLGRSCFAGWPAGWAGCAGCWAVRVAREARVRIPPARYRFMINDSLVFGFLKTLLHALFGRAARRVGSALDPQGILILPGRLRAVARGVGEAAQVHVTPGLHRRFRGRFQRLLEQPFGEFGIL